MDRFEAGGNAFPDDDYYGMTLRDYFAAKAMQALISNNNLMAWDLDGHEDDGDVRIAVRAYILADSMILQRED
jgi:hypothetical protein